VNIVPNNKNTIPYTHSRPENLNATKGDIRAFILCARQGKKSKASALPIKYTKGGISSATKLNYLTAKF
jgi:hypothetical protein